MGKVDEAALLTRLCEGDEAAFCTLFARYQRQIYLYASRMCGCAAGDDVVQETFLSVLKPSGRFDPAKGTVAGYLFGIARHHVIRRLAKQGTVLAEPPEELALTGMASQETPFDAMARDQMIDAVRQAVQSLPPVYREVVALCDLEELDYATVAHVIQCPIGTVRSRLHRARALLLRKLTSLQCVVAASRG
jgi:RNA polymerase sigma-70 factor (ECF subfamily)